MASGNTLLILDAQSHVPPATAYATPDTFAGAATPNEAFPVLDFDASATEYSDWHGLILPAHYSGGGLTIIIVAFYPTTTGGVRWDAAIRRLDTSEDADTTAHTYSYQGVTVSSLPGTIGFPGYHTITMTSGSQMDSLAAGEAFILRVKRTHDDAGDTMSGDASLYTIHIKET